MKKLLLPWLLSCLFLILSGCTDGKLAEVAEKPNPAHPSSFVTRQELYGFLSMPETAEAISGRIVSGVLPHHLTAGKMIAGVIAKIAVQKPRVLIIVGPNHENAGAKVITGYYDWQTPEGIVQAEPEIVRALLASNMVSCDETVLAGEHSIGSIVPFIRHYLPETRIVPLILHHGVSIEQVDALLEVLKPYLEKDVVLLASVDFSHYLSRRQAYDRDEVTLQAMREWDYNKLFHLDSGYLDSPASLALGFRVAQKNGSSDFQVVEHSNSGDILKNDLIETTSYFTLLFVEQEK